MKCINKNIFLYYLNDEISSRKKKQIAAHLLECEHCRKHLAEWEKVLNITQQFIDQDMKIHPAPPHAHITQQFGKVPPKPDKLFWIRYWTKPALATVAVLFASLMIFFLSPRSVPTPQENYYVIDNVAYTETISLSDVYLNDLEIMYLQEIYENEELTDDILYGDWLYYEEVLNDLNQDELEELINKMYGNGVT